jgi:hypothetical protein
MLERKQTVLAEAPKHENFRSSGPEYGRRNDGCLVVSFDSSWYAFLDDTRAYNRRESRCWHIPGNPLLDCVIKEMKTLNRLLAGGRAFLHNDGALIVDGIELVRWSLAAPSQYLLKRREIG